MNTFNALVDIFDLFTRKKTMGMWIWILTFAAVVTALSIYNAVAIFAPEGDVGSIIIFTLCAMFFACGLAFQLNNKPQKLFMVVHTRTGLAVLKTPVTENVAKLHSLGVRGDAFSYIPYKDYLKMKEANL